MADRRMKAVAGDAGVDGDDELVQEEERFEDMDELDLGLTLGCWGWTTGKSDNGQPEYHVREALPPVEGGVGSSRYFERQGFVPQPSPQLVGKQPNARDWGAEMFGIQLEGQGDVGSQEEALEEMDRASSDTDMDTQHKRPKVLLALEVLKLSACKYLTDSSLDALYKEGALPVLRELDLSYSSIGQTAITELLTYCTNLVHINLNGCANMQELVWYSNDCHPTDMMIDECLPNIMTEDGKTDLRKSKHLLEILNFTGCPNIKKVLIPSMANCFLLSKINLNLSTNLKEVDLTCLNLSTLNLSYCSSLEILKLNCPRLNNLQLLACSMLEEEELEVAISKCKMLEILNIHACPKLYAEDFERLHGLCPSLKRVQGSLSL